ncbi:ATP-binding protein [Tateyamaria armeniaca]|uniref:histidine kinase n=1 Tax=Tateyamaria armeniaca TaxID=2518930 RepID=A0ABW8UWR0_9RHOB
MKLGLNRYRMTVMAGICLLIFLLAIMVTNLLSQLRGLSAAAQDNMQWSISQIDTEFANLDAMLIEQMATGRFPDDEVQLRVDIALSRLNIINSGRAAEIFEGNAQAADMIAPLNTFARAAVALSDAPGPLRGEALDQMHQLVHDVRPHARDIALLGVSLGAAQSEARRAQFASQLARTGGIAIALLVLMAILMLFLDRLLQRAARRDAALSASSAQLSSTVAASLDAIVTAEATGRIVGFNASAERVFGWRRDEIVGQKMEDTFIPHRMRAAHTRGVKRYLETGTRHFVDAGRFEMSAQRKNGDEFPVEMNITTTQDGDETRFIAYIRDISARKSNEQKLIEARDRAEQTDKAKSRFLTVMSHEMRSPLNGILGVLDLLKTTKLDDQQARYAQIATSSSEILLEHVNEALDITRIETGELQLTMQDFDLVDLIQGLVDVFDPLAREKNLTLALEIEQNARGHYHGDAGRIRQILTNLIGNAIKFTETGGIALHVSGDHGPETSSLRFEVIDTGIGIPPDQHEQVFADFFALARSEGRQARGDGLGLSISRRIARAMDGDVSLKSAEGNGSVFVLSLPLERGGAVTDTMTTDTQPTPMRPCDVLIVEDNSINRHVLSDMLSTMGHSVHQAVNGADCIDKGRDQRFDVIFMDISMPVMDGIEATRRLRSGNGANAQTHIVGLTAHGREEYREMAVASGMNRFHTKPIRLDALRTVFADVTLDEWPKADTERPPDALAEMVELLGRDRVASTADRFLSELAAFTADLRTGMTMQDSAVIAEAAHKAKGAASLLGQYDLETSLAALEEEARNDALLDAETWAAQLDTAAHDARSAFDAALRQVVGNP